MASMLVYATALCIIVGTREISLAEEPETSTQQEQSSQDVPTDVTTRGISCDDQSNRMVIDQIQKELARNFRPDDAKGLYARRQRLKTLFSRVPRTCTRQLYEQLGPKATSDKLSKQFHYRLATATRVELLGILKANFPSPPQQIPPSQPPAASPPTQVWYTNPLPKTELPRFMKALEDLERKVATSTQSKVVSDRYRCWFNKLKTNDVDDRLIPWSRICPTSGAIGAAFVVGSCDLTIGKSPVNQLTLEKNIRSVNDVERANEALQLITYLKSDIVVSYEMKLAQLENLKQVDEDKNRATKKLNQWANAQQGGSSGMPPAYRAIMKWLQLREHDPKSLYSCF